MSRMLMDVSDIIERAGGPTRVARTIKRHHTTVLGWKRVPAAHAREIAMLAGLQPSEVRPDLYGPREMSMAEQAAAVAA